MCTYLNICAFLKYSIDLEYDEQMITNYQTFFHFSYSLKSVFPDSIIKIFSRFFPDVFFLYLSVKWCHLNAKGRDTFFVFHSISISSEFVLGKFCQQIWRCHHVPMKGWDIKAYVMHTSWHAEQFIHVFVQSRRLK